MTLPNGRVVELGEGETLREHSGAVVVTSPEPETTFAKILAAVDGSEHSMRAMAAAAQLARRYGSELLIVSVAAPAPYLSLDRGPATLRGLMEAAEEESRRAVEMAQGIALKQGVRPRTLVEAGPVREVLLQVIERYKPDLVVVGSRGLSTLKRLWLGSVSETLVFNAGCKVLVVR